MSQKLTNEDDQKELSWEDAVSRYLEDHPEYFQRHPRILANLNLRHEGTGRAVSLIEYQVQALRGNNQELQRQLRELVGHARENDALGERLHRFALAVVGAGTPDEALDTAYELLRQEFQMDVIAVLWRREPVPGRREFVGPDDARLNELLKQFRAGRPLCGGKQDESLLHYLFGERAREIRSSALIPLGEPAPQGVLGLGSHDPQRFHPGMGTVYLTRLGELLVRAIAVHT
jgi:uncharacterized protein YigA (DUF484 family)